MRDKIARRGQYVARTAKAAASYIWSHPLPNGSDPSIRNYALYSGLLSLDPEFREDVFSIFEQVIPKDLHRDFARLPTLEKRAWMDRVISRAKEIERNIS